MDISLDADQNDSIFHVMNKIDVRLAHLKPKVILLVGNEDAGKSTAFNWISKFNMVGVLEGKRGNNVNFEVEVKDQQNMARIGNALTPCTIVPCVNNIDDFTLVDTASLNKSKDYRGAVAISYALGVIFQKAQQLRFIIVVKQSWLYDHVKELISTLSNFISLFKAGELTGQVKQRIFESVCLLLTKSKCGKFVDDHIANCLEKIGNPQFKIANKQFIIELLTHLRQSKKFVFFERAEKDKPAVPSNIWQSLKDKSWPYFPIKSQMENKSIILLPFSSNFKQLPESEQQQRKMTGDKIKFYEKIGFDLHEVIRPYITVENINQVTFDNAFFFDKISNFLKENDHYSSQHYIDQTQAKILKEQPRKLEAVKAILDMCEASLTETVVQSPAKASSKQTEWAKYSSKYNAICDVLMQLFPMTAEQAKLILQLKFVLLRGIRQFSMLSSISTQQASVSNLSFRNGLRQIFIKHERTRKYIQENYVKSFFAGEADIPSLLEGDEKIKFENYFSNREEVAKLLQFLMLFHSNYSSGLVIIEFFPLLRNTKLVMAKYYYSENNENEAKKYLIEAIQVQCQYERILPIKHSTENPNGSAELVQLFSMQMQNEYLKRTRILMMLQIVLVQIHSYQSALKIAINNCDIYSACNIYEKMLITQSNYNEKKALLEQYSEFCFNHNKRSKAITLLQECIKEDGNTFEVKAELHKKIHSIVEGKEQSKKLYLQYRQKFKVINIDDPSVSQLTTLLKSQLSH